MSETSEVSAPKATPRAVKELRKLIKAIDGLTQNADIKIGKVADLTLEKSVLVRALLAAEAETEESEREQRITTLEQQHTADQSRIAELERTNRELRVASETPRVEHVPDPNHARVRESLESLRLLVSTLIATLPDTSRIEAAVRVVQSCGQVIAGEICRTLKIDMGNIVSMLRLAEVDLIRFQQANDQDIAGLARMIRRIKFPPPPVQIVAPVTRPEPPKLEQQFDDSLEARSQRAVEAAKEQTRRV